jgi:hypothetical protein
MAAWPEAGGRLAGAVDCAESVGTTAAANRASTVREAERITEQSKQRGTEPAEV